MAPSLRGARYRCSQSGLHRRHQRLHPTLSMLTALLLLCCLALFEPATARKRTKSRRSVTQPSQSASNGSSDIAPAPLITTLGSNKDGGSASLHHLFTTPLYVADISASVDAAAMSTLALEGCSIVAKSASVQKAMIDLKLATMPAAEQASPEAAAQLNDASVFTHNDKFFYYQIANVAKCVTDATPECGNVRWDNYFLSSVKKQLEAAIGAAVPQYFASIGVSQSELPAYTITIWASVMTPGASHTEHEHSSAGECLASGVYYAATPEGSGAIRFTDHRQHLHSHPMAFPTTAGYDLQPSAGQLVMFPPWLLHRVLPSQYEESEVEHWAEQPLRVSWAFNIMVKTSSASIRERCGVGRSGGSPRGLVRRAAR